MTDHVFETAATGRARCRGCGEAIAKGSLRFGERLPNLYGDGTMTHWHHPRCAAFRRPEALAEALAAGGYPGDDGGALEAIATRARSCRRLQRLGRAERAPSGRARCRHCRRLIEQDHWRVPLIFFDEGSYSASGFIHANCARGYCETDDVVDAIVCFSMGLGVEAVATMVFMDAPAERP